MKKLFSIILCLCMVCTAVGGCGSGQGKSFGAAKAEPSVPPEDIAASGVDYGLNWYITKSGHLSVTGHMDPALASRLESLKEEQKRVGEEFMREIEKGQLTGDEIKSKQEELTRAAREQLPWPWIKDNHAAELQSASLKFTGATDLYCLFIGAENLQKADLTDLDTGKVTDMTSMFDGCSSLTSLDLGSFDTRNVTNMAGMFQNCSSLTSLDLRNFNTRNVTNMTSMFYGCSSLSRLDLGSFDTHNVTNMACMFYSCSSLPSLDLGSFDTRNVTDMQGMFGYCICLTSLDLRNFDTRNVTTMVAMFCGCSNLKEIQVGNDWKDALNADGMFAGCGVSSVTRK